MKARAGIPPRLLAVIAPVTVGGLAVLVAAVVTYARQPPQTTAELVGFVVLLLASAIAQRFPVPLDGVDSTGVSLMFVFGVATIDLFGWAAGVLVVSLATAISMILEHRPGVRVAYNVATFALSALAGAIAIQVVAETGTLALVLRITACSLAFFLVNILLITAAICAGSSDKPFWGSVYTALRTMSIPFALMGSAALILVVLWDRDPALSIALVGPLLAIALYQRSTSHALKAMRLALTDPLTGLGNHRHFHERLQQALVEAEEQKLPVTVCLVDIDDFKRVNDRFGHPSGDRVLAQVSSRLRQGGEAFRLGGDEFAVLLPGHDEEAALAAGNSIVDRIAGMKLEHVGSVTVSAGIATYPAHGVGRDELIRLADSALYWAKERGKNRVRLYRPDVVELAELKRLATGPDRAARYRAAASLAKAVDARDAYTGSHSQRVSELAARIALQLGADVELVELTRLAASLHDLGKLAVPEEILRKPGPLTDPERMVLERHPQIGFRMLESLGVDPVAEWVLHHHERWDGTGYPDGLHGDSIPLGARIIFVADAYDAMTSERVYQRRLTDEEALRELNRCAGTQFDPEVVAAFAADLGAELDVSISVA